MRAILVCGLLSLSLLALGGPQEISLPEGVTAFKLAWTPDGSGLVVLYATDEEGDVAEQLEVPSGASRWRVSGLEISRWTPSLAFSSDGETLAVGEQRGVRLISASDGVVLRTIELEEPFHPLALAFRPDGTLAMVVEEVRGFPGELYLEIRDLAGDLVERRSLGRRMVPSSRPKAAFSPDGRFLAYAAGTEEEPGGEAWLVHLLDLETGALRTWNLRGLLPDWPWADLRVGIAGVAVRPDGREVAVGLYSADAGRPLVLRLDAETGGLIGQLLPSEWEDYMVEELTYSSEGNFLAFPAYSAGIRGAPQTLAIANLVREEPQVTLLCQEELPGGCPNRSPCFSPDGRTLASLWQSTVRLWSLCPAISQLPSPEWTFTFSSGGAYHPEGLGEWRVRLDASGGFEVEHQTFDEMETFGPFRLEAEENQRLWALIQAADLPDRESSTRPGLPDEVQYTFALEGLTCIYRVRLWIGDAREDEALMALVDGLTALIERYTGEAPRL